MTEDTFTLLLDDDPVFLEELSESLHREGIKVVCASTSESALDILRHNPRLRVLVTDLAMPGLGGLDVIRAAREMRPPDELAAIVVTGMGNYEAAVESLRMSVADFIDKPLNPKELATAIRRSAIRLLAGELSRPSEYEHSIAEGEHFGSNADHPLTNLGLDPTAVEMLVLLATSHQADRCVSVTGLCQSAGRSASTALRRLHSLEERGLVVRTPDPFDKRRTWVQITDEGVACVKQVASAYRKALGPVVGVAAHLTTAAQAESKGAAEAG